MTPDSISVVIPVFNSQEALPALLERLHPVLSRLTAEYEVVLVNDGSKDASWSVLCRLAARYPWVRIIDLMRNYGQHNALLCGIREARHAIIVTMDDDLQHPPEELPKLIATLAEGNDVVYGIPQREQHGLWRDLASTMTKLAMQSALGVGIARNVSAFRAFRSEVRNASAYFRSPFVLIDVLLTWGTNRFAAVPVRHDPRRQGVSNYTFMKLVTHAVNMMTGFSTLPLQLSSYIGFACTGLGLLLLVFVLGVYAVSGGTVPGFTFLACMIAIFSGAQLLALGVIGEYLARMHFSTMERPPYSIRSTFPDLTESRERAQAG
jgi:undecaprenyl-phosphate 4-deoxy-4-formamido-L-arabinose transferase